MSRIEPRTLKGFRDYLPQQMIAKEQLLEKARRVYRSYGFAPIDTPALEYAEILLGKGGEESDKIIYRFTDHGGRDRSEEHTSELQSRQYLVCRLLLEKKKKTYKQNVLARL